MPGILIVAPATDDFRLSRGDELAGASRLMHVVQRGRLSESAWNFGDSGPRVNGYMVTVVAASSILGWVTR